jgi:probable phosphoglycerate mutase
MTILALLRHGETAWSREGRIQGRTDIPLNETGRNTLRERMLPQAFCEMHVVTSPLSRCVQTAEALGLSHVTVEERIAEMRWGKWEGKRLAELRSELGEDMRLNEAQGLDFAPPEGESPRQVLARVGEWLTEIGKSDRSTLAVTHRGVIRVIYAQAAGWDMRSRPPHKLDWAALHVFVIDAAGCPSVQSLNLPLAMRPGLVPPGAAA